MKLLVIDIETTGLDLLTDEITEFAWVLYETDNKRIVSATSFILKGSVPISQEIEHLTGITSKLRENNGLKHSLIVDQILTTDYDFIIAHNALGMEKPWLEKYGLKIPTEKWIDTCVDVPYPPHITTRKLTHLCADHAIPTSGAHEALADVLMTVELLKRYDINKVIAYKNEPSVELIAKVSFEKKDLAKDQGFRWNGEKKTWSKVVKSFEVEKIKAACEFPILEIPIKQSI